MKIQESGEDYLEAVLVLKQTKGIVHSIDVARHLNFSKPSVSRAMKLLREDGDVTMDADGAIELTEKGLQIAESIYERHCLLSTWLAQLGVNEEQAAADACRMEHVLSTETFEKLKAHVLESMDSSQNGPK